MTRKRNTKPGQVQSTTKPKKKVGRKPKYTPELVETVCGMLTEDTFTVREICRAVGIEETTYYRWLEEKNEFKKAIEKAREDARENFAVIAKHSLKRLIQGYTAIEKTVAEKIIKGQVVTTTSITEKVYKPDTTAVIFTLTNVEAENWKHKHHLEADVKTTEDVSFTDLESCMDNLDDDELQALKDIALKVKKLNPGAAVKEEGEDDE